jgi:uncharacterized membrane protein
MLGSIIGVLVMGVNQIIATALGNYPEWLTWSWADLTPSRQSYCLWSNMMKAHQIN